MDRTQENMKFVGFFGIINQSLKTIFKNKKIFTQITISLLLPLTLIFIAHNQISRHIFYKIEKNLLSTYRYTDRYSNVSVTDRYGNVSVTVTDRYSNVSVMDWIYYLLFGIISIILLTIFSVLSTAAIVYTTASVYTARDVTFRHVTKILPRIWKNLSVTFLYIYIALFLYDVVYDLIVIILRAIFGYSTFSLVLMFVLLVLYLYGFLYLSVVWQLASVVTVLEDLHGFKSMKKGKNLLYGKKKVGMAIAFVMYLLLVGLMIVSELFVDNGDENFNLHVIWRVMIGILCGLLLLIWFLLFTVMQTVLYLVCKSFHREAIDKLRLSTLLGAYAGETLVLPNTGEEIQLQIAQSDPVVAQEV